VADFRALNLYVLRHGQCEHNVEDRVAAQNDSPLTARGREQACANGRLLTRIAGDLARLDFFASPLHRTCATMELLREAAGQPATGYRADRRLMEIDMGDDTWKFRKDLSHFGADHWDHVRPNGESMAQVHARVGAFLAGLAGDAVIVTHAGPLRMIRAHLLGLSRRQALDYHPPNAGIMRLCGGIETIFGE
jgi:broad specificity phosphatase PhoE